MIANYHSHSRWCGHGEKELEDYVVAAIQAGLVEMAICDYAPADNTIGGPRMPWSQLKEYLAEVATVQGKYQDQLSLVRSMECEYYPEVMDQFYKLRQDQEIQYWILGQHESWDHRYNYFAMKDKEKELAQYTKDVITGLNTGLFQILAHPDVIMVNFEKPTAYLLACMDEIFQVCQDKNIIVEINANGLRNHAGYPNYEVWQCSKKYKLTTIISSDAHNPNVLVDHAVKQAEQLAKQWGIEITEKLNLFDKPNKTV